MADACNSVLKHCFFLWGLVFDIGGFGLLALFNGYVASIDHAKAAAWIPTFQLTTACSVVAFVCLTAAILLEEPEVLNA